MFFYTETSVLVTPFLAAWSYTPFLRGREHHGAQFLINPRQQRASIDRRRPACWMNPPPFPTTRKLSRRGQRISKAFQRPPMDEHEVANIPMLHDVRLGFQFAVCKRWRAVVGKGQRDDLGVVVDLHDTEGHVVTIWEIVRHDVVRRVAHLPPQYASTPPRGL